MLKWRRKPLRPLETLAVALANADMEIDTAYRCIPLTHPDVAKTTMTQLPVELQCFPGDLPGVPP